MPRAQLLLLQHKTRIRKGTLHHFGTVASHNPYIFCKNRAQGFNHAGKHGLAQQGLQHLWPVGMHAGSLARRKNQSRVLRHEYLLQSPHVAKNCAGRAIASCGANSKTTGKKRRGGFMPDLRASAAACPKYKVWHRCCADGHPSLRQKYRPA